MNKHTPAPWKIVGVPHQEFWITDSESPEHGKQNVIAMLQPHWRGNQSGDIQANARLIAAAPAMLEALEACAAYWHYKRNPGIPEQSELVSLSAEQAQRLIKAAIRAAKGEV